MPPTDLVPLLIAKKDPTKIKASGYLDDIARSTKKTKIKRVQVLVFLLKLTQRTSDDPNFKK